MMSHRYGRAPAIKINGDTTAAFSYIPVHFEYILQELFINAFRATVEQNADAKELPVVMVTVCFNGASATWRMRSVHVQ